MGSTDLSQYSRICFSLCYKSIFFVFFFFLMEKKEFIHLTVWVYCSFTTHKNLILHIISKNGHMNIILLTQYLFTFIIFKHNKKFEE